MLESKVNENVKVQLNTFLSSLKYAVEELKLSYGYLGRIFGVSRTAVYCWVRGYYRPRAETAERCYMIIHDIVEANTYSQNLSHFSLNHMGPPDNMFSFKASDNPLMRKVLGLLTYYEGLLSIGNRVLLDTAAYYIRGHIEKNRVKRSEAGMLALAALKVSMLKFGVNRSISHLIEDPETYTKFFTELSLTYLSEARGREVAESEQQ